MKGFPFLIFIKIGMLLFYASLQDSYNPNLSFIRIIYKVLPLVFEGGLYNFRLSQLNFKTDET